MSASSESAYLRDLRAELVVAERSRWHPRRLLNVAIGALVLAVLFAGLWGCLLGPAIGGDPALDQQADVVCPLACEGCRGPYVFYWEAVHRSGSHSGASREVACHSDEGHLVDVPLGITVVFVALIPIGVLPALVVIALWWPFRRRADEERCADLARRIAEAERMPPVS